MGAVTYRDFSQLSQHERAGVDYLIHHRAGRSGLLVMAPHGGGIESGTGDIADAIAGHRHAYYCFAATKRRGNRALHIPSHHFNEPRGLAMAHAADWVMTIHGCRETKPIVWVGGRDRTNGDTITKALLRSGILSQRCEDMALRGLHPDNLCNLGQRKGGVQLEFSLGVRKLMFDDIGQPSLVSTTPLFHRLVNTIASCIRNGLGLPATGYENLPPGNTGEANGANKQS